MPCAFGTGHIVDAQYKFAQTQKVGLKKTGKRRKEVLGTSLVAQW